MCTCDTDYSILKTNVYCTGINTVFIRVLNDKGVYKVILGIKRAFYLDYDFFRLYNVAQELYNQISGSYTEIM